MHLLDGRDQVLKTHTHTDEDQVVHVNVHYVHLHVNYIHLHVHYMHMYMYISKTQEEKCKFPLEGLLFKVRILKRRFYQAGFF